MESFHVYITKIYLNSLANLKKVSFCQDDRTEKMRRDGQSIKGDAMSLTGFLSLDQLFGNNHILWLKCLFSNYGLGVGIPGN